MYTTTINAASASRSIMFLFLFHFTVSGLSDQQLWDKNQIGSVVKILKTDHSFSMFTESTATRLQMFQMQGHTTASFSEVIFRYSTQSFSGIGPGNTSGFSNSTTNSYNKTLINNPSNNIANDPKIQQSLISHWINAPYKFQINEFVFS